MSKNDEIIDRNKALIREQNLTVVDGAITGDVTLFEKAIEQDGLSLKDVEKAVKATVNYAAAAHGVSGEIAAEAMKADDSLESVTTNFSLGAVGSLNGNIKKATTYNVAGKTGVSLGTNRAEIEFAPGRTGTPLNAEVSGIKALFSAEFKESK